MHDFFVERAGGNRNLDMQAPCLGVSRYNDEYFCTVRRAMSTSAGELRVWFEAVGDTTLGELQDPGLSVVGLTEEAASQGVAEDAGGESRVWRPVSVDLAAQTDRRRRIVGSVTFEGMAAVDQVFFRYGSGGYSSCPLAVERASALLSTEEGVAPLCVSRYNGKYFCNVHRGKVLPSGEAHLSFTVVGDMSMGQLQEPSASKVFWIRSAGQHSTQRVAASPADVRLVTNDKKYHISGTLVYQGLPVEQDVEFEYGSGGYSKVPVRLEVVPSVVLTLSTARGPDGSLLMSCTNMAGAEMALVKASDLEPEESISQLRRLLVERLNIEDGQLRLIMQDGTLLGDEHNERLLSEVFGSSPPCP